MEMYIGLAIVAVILIWAIFTYNRFISLRRFKDEAWSGIAVQLSAVTIWRPICSAWSSAMRSTKRSCWKRSAASAAF